MQNRKPSKGSSSCVRDLLSEASSRLDSAGVSSPSLDAEVLLAHVLGVDRSFLYLRMRDEVPADCRDLFEACVRRRETREPVAYITGVKGFWKFDFHVDENVLIPRPDTECIVEEVLSCFKQKQKEKPLRVLEMGTGSGAIVVCLAAEAPENIYFASDLKPGAARVAAGNAFNIGVSGRVNFLCGDWFGPFSRRSAKFDLIVSNPPYIPEIEIEGLEPDVRAFEPLSALSGSGDGLRCLREIIFSAPGFLSPSGALFLEMAHDQKGPVTRLAEECGGYSRVRFVKDLAGHDRVAVLEKKDCE